MPCRRDRFLRWLRHPVLPVSDPFGERRSLPVPVVKTCHGIREVAGEEVSFVGGQHRSLRIWCMERGYRAATSDPDVSVDCNLHYLIERAPTVRTDECAYPAREATILRRSGLEHRRRTAVHHRTNAHGVSRGPS